MTGGVLLLHGQAVVATVSAQYGASLVAVGHIIGVGVPLLTATHADPQLLGRHVR